MCHPSERADNQQPPAVLRSLFVQLSLATSLLSCYCELLSPLLFFFFIQIAGLLSNLKAHYASDSALRSLFRYAAAEYPRSAAPPRRFFNIQRALCISEEKVKAIKRRSPAFTQREEAFIACIPNAAARLLAGARKFGSHYASFSLASLGFLVVSCRLNI